MSWGVIAMTLFLVGMVAACGRDALLDRHPVRMMPLVRPEFPWWARRRSQRERRRWHFDLPGRRR